MEIHDNYFKFDTLSKGRVPRCNGIGRTGRESQRTSMIHKRFFFTV